jgi:hypothetical protein
MIEETDIDILKKSFLPFLNKFVAVGVPHHQDDSRNFYHFGTVVGLGPTGLHLQLKEEKGGLLILPYTQIREIRTGCY